MEADFSSPTPLASAVSALATLLAVALVYSIVSLLRGKPKRGEEKGDTAFERLIEGVRAVDRAIVHGASWVTGTRYRKSYVRIPVELLFFLALTAAAVFAPWPWGLIPILVGVLGIFAVFRHWSRDEDEALDDVPDDRKDIPIEGNLNREVLIAVGFLFVFAPIAFSQLQAHGFGFEIAPTAGPFTFVIYTLIETLKAGSLVDYYDLFADRLGFEKISGAKNPSAWAKWVILAYRLSLNLLVLAALKRLLDIARRKAEGLDLRHIEEKLEGSNEEEQLLAVQQLKSFAMRGRGNARDLLERILQPNRSDSWQLGPDVRYATASALYDYADGHGGMGSLYAAIEGYRAILRSDWKRTSDATDWARTQNNLGTALSSLGELTGSGERLEEAVAAYRAALEVYTRDEMPADWAGMQNNLGTTLSMLGELTGSGERLEEAVAAYRGALEVYNRDEMPAGWAMTQNNLGVEEAGAGVAVEGEADVLVLPVPGVAAPFGGTG